MSGSLFPGVAHDARGHLGLRYYEAVLAVVAYAGARAAASGAEPDAVLDEHPFLHAYLREVPLPHEGEVRCDDALRWLRREVRRWEAAVRARLPLRALRDEPGFGDAQVLALLVVGMVEEDARFGALFAAAQGGASRRPTVALVHQVVAGATDGADGAAGDAWALCRPLLDAGLVEALNPGDPRADWQLRVPAPLWTAVSGDTPAEPLPGVRWHPPASFATLDELVLDDAPRGRAAEAGALLASGRAEVLVVRGLAGSERLELVGAVARGLGRGVLEAVPPGPGVPEAWRVLGALAALVGAVPAFVLEMGPGETFEVPAWGGCRVPAAVVAGHDGGVGGAAAERAVLVHLPPETPALRRRHWARALPGAPAATHAALAEAYTLGGRYVRRAAELAQGHAALDGRAEVTTEDVRAAARSINRQQLDALAARLEDGGGWERLVLHRSTAAELLHLERRCRHREQLAGALGDGIPGGMNRGVRALFQGPSGTGKTLAARVLASELGLDLYRVDLSTIVNKYIGETEKNLARVLGRAEDLDVVLLLDEGDSLMGKRTEVRSSNDRWANLETNYLLQRLDTYTGIVFVTTNSPGSIDSAFQRRMDAVV
ncbi:MAG TPA: AAA family ATPase, partial [Longimicrobium sp.]|nr:AAA family ATPase [Longimicrobium sp.]